MAADLWLRGDRTGQLPQRGGAGYRNRRNETGIGFVAGTKIFFMVVRSKVRQMGLPAFSVYAARRLAERFWPPRCACAELCRSLTQGRHGLEIGGPSKIFSLSGLLPVYGTATRIDGLNFSAETVWAGGLGEDEPYCYGTTVLGRQFVREASDFGDIESSSFDFVLSSHVIEHLADPMRGLREWGRVLRDDGTLILVVPHKDGTFDHRRPVTTIEHILDDFRNETAEDDRTHIPEVLELHDFERDHWAESRDAFRKRCEDNPQNRCVHHHVFDTELAARLVHRAGFVVLAIEHAMPSHIVIVCSKPAAGTGADNSLFLDASAAWRVSSPFPSDRRVVG